MAVSVLFYLINLAKNGIFGTLFFGNFLKKYRSVLFTKALLNGHHDRLFTSQRDAEDVFLIAKKVVHPGFDPSTFQNDFAVLELHKPVAFSRSVQPICLFDSHGKIYKRQTGTIKGWGVVDTKLSMKTTQLMEVAVIIMQRSLTIGRG